MAEAVDTETSEIEKCYDELFAYRYTDKDEDYVKVQSKPIPPCPCVPGYFLRGKKNYNNRDRDSRQYGGRDRWGHQGNRDNHGYHGNRDNRSYHGNRDNRSYHDNRHQDNRGYRENRHSNDNRQDRSYQRPRYNPY